nr:uncharacterized protein [Tanacetum cinerariifolium]
MVKETQEYGKNYVPKVVSIGPYHFDNPKLKMVEKVKPCFTMKLLMNNKEALKSLYKKLGKAEMVKELRNYYEEKSTDQFSDKVFTKMMLLDGCFILYYIKFIFGEKLETCQELKSHQIVFIHQDMFLLENQIPFKVLNEVMNLMNDAEYCYTKIKPFINENILARERPNRRWTCFRSYQSSGEEAKMELINKNSDHLLHLLHHSLTKKHSTPENDFKQTMINKCINFIGGIRLISRNNRCTFRNVNELMDVGIDFKPSGSMSLAHIEVFKSWWFFSANVELPPITVDDSTKPMFFLNGNFIKKTSKELVITKK